MKDPYSKQHKLSLETGPANKTEGWALIELARRMEAIRLDPPEDLEKIREVVRLNWRVWTIFQANLVDDDCEVPEPIRGNLLRLSNYIDRRSLDILTDVETSKLEILISINRNIGAGLMGDGGDEKEIENAEKLAALEKEKTNKV